MDLKFMYNGIKINSMLYKASYSKSCHTEEITIYAATYKDFPRIPGLKATNGTDIMTDYFEKDRIRVTPDNPHHPAVMEAYRKQEARYAARRAKGLAKRSA